MDTTPTDETPRERLARGGGWWTLILGLIMLLSVTEAVNAAAWSDGLSIVRLAVFGGALMAFLLALTRWDGLIAALYGFLASLYWLTRLFNWFMFSSMTAQESIQELLQRNGEWLYALLHGRASADNLIFITQLALLGWWIGFLAIWSLIRHQRIVHAIIPAGVALLVNAYFAQANLTGFIIMYLAAVLLLAIRVELARNEARWQISQVRYPPDIAIDFLKAGVMFSAVVIVLAWSLPNAANQITVEKLLRPFESPWHNVQDTWQRMYQSLNYGQAARRIAAYGKSSVLSGPVSLTDRPIFDAQTPERVYWQAAIYDTYTSQGWLNSDPDVVALDRFESLGAPQYSLTREITATIQPREAGQTVIFGPPSPVRVSVPVNADYSRIPGTAGLRTTSLLESRINLNRLAGYQVVATVSDASPDLLRADNTNYPQWVIDRYLQLPDTLPERVKELAAGITKTSNNPYDKAEVVEAVLRTYKYNQDIAAPPAGADGVDYFLFGVKQGYCDYYASAMVVMLRSIGVPARFVIGYTPGQIVPQQEQSGSDVTPYHVLERNAHAWPEVYFPTYGWIQFEPTASEPVLARPASVEQQPVEPGLNQDHPTDIGDNSDLFPDKRQPLNQSALQSADSFAFWIRRNWGWLALALGIVALIGGGWALWQRQQNAFLRNPESLGRLFGLLGMWAARLRIPWPSSHTPLEHAAAFDSRLPEAAPAVDRITALFVAQQYGRQQPSSETLTGVARNWQSLQPKLWRRWIGEAVETRGSRSNQSQVMTPLRRHGG